MKGLTQGHATAFFADVFLSQVDLHVCFGSFMPSLFLNVKS